MNTGRQVKVGEVLSDQNVRLMENGGKQDSAANSDTNDNTARSTQNETDIATLNSEQTVQDGLIQQNADDIAISQTMAVLGDSTEVLALSAVPTTVTDYALGGANNMTESLPNGTISIPEDGFYTVTMSFILNVSGEKNYNIAMLINNGSTSNDVAGFSVGPNATDVVTFSIQASRAFVSTEILSVQFSTSAGRTAEIIGSSFEVARRF